MDNSILNTVKRYIGLTEDYMPFDVSLITAINMAIATLTQIGVGPEEGFRINDANATWNDFIGESQFLGFIKDYVCLKARHEFDPPASSSVMQAIENQIKELEFRLYVAFDKPIETEVQND